jgi:hypothetical protein
MANETSVADQLRTISKSVVYFITPIHSRRVKIGVTTNVEKRLKALQTGHHAKLAVLLIIPGDSIAERSLHNRFKKDHELGEWFVLSDAIKAFIIENGGERLAPSGSYSTKTKRTFEQVWERMGQIPA